MMNCRKARFWISLCLDGLLSSDQAEALREHLRTCPGCRAEWKFLRAIQKVLTTTEPAPPPFDMTPVIMERVKAIDRERTSKGWRWLGAPGWRWLMTAVVPILLALTLLGIWWRQTPPPPPHDSLYLSAHVTSAVAAPELSPVSITFASVSLIGEE